MGWKSFPLKRLFALVTVFSIALLGAFFPPPASISGNGDGAALAAEAGVSLPPPPAAAGKDEAGAETGVPACDEGESGVPAAAESPVSGTDFQEAGASRWGMVSGWGLDGEYHVPQWAVSRMAVFGGELYAGTSTEGPADIWRKGTGGWVAADPPNFDSYDYMTMNLAVTSMAVFHNPLTMADNLLVGTGNLSGCQIWKYDGTAWSQAVGTYGPLDSGFMDAGNRAALSMAVFGDHLYVGTARDSGDLQIWRFNGAAWGRVDGGAFAGTGNTAATSMCVFGGYLYVGMQNSSGCRVWRSPNGTAWAPVTTGGFGNPNNRSVVSLAVFGGQLYAGTLNAAGGGQVWRTPDGITWSRVDGGWFGVSNTAAASLHPYGGNLYVGTENHSTGAQVWRTSDGTTWYRVDGGVLGELNETAVSMAVLGGLLYVGTEGYGQIFYTDGTSWGLSNQPYFTYNANAAAASALSLGSYLYVGTEGATGGEVWRHDGSAWTVLGTGGLGDRDNRRVSSLGTLGGQLYAGVSNEIDGCRVYRFEETSGFVQVNADGFGDPANRDVLFLKSYAGKLFAGTYSTGPGGGQLWAYDGVSWAKVSADGFGDPGNRGMYSFAVYGGPHIYVGTYNTGGCQVWSSSMAGGPPYADWTKVGDAGFDGASNAALCMAVFDGKLMVGTQRGSGPCDVWAYDGTYWARAATPGFGKAGNVAAISMAVHRGRLYVGTGGLHPLAGGTGCEVWSTAGAGGLPYADWRQENDPGFGDAGTTRALCMAVYFDRVHVGTENALRGCAVWSTGSVWYLAEGATDLGFETYVLVQNPGARQVRVDFTLNTGAGELRPPELQGVPVPAGSRRTFNLEAYVRTTDLSTRVSCRNGAVLCERAVYWRAGPGSPWTVGHDSTGVTAPARTWYLAEGATDLGFETYVLVQNPGGAPAHVDVVLNTGGGEVALPELQDVLVPAGSRRTFNLGNYVRTTDVSTRVSSRDNPVVCERAVYWRPSPGSPWALGHDSAGATSTGIIWYLAEGATDLGFETYVLVQSTGPNAATLNFTLNTGGGEVRPPELQGVLLAAGSRRTFNLGAYVRTTDVSVRVEAVGELVVCERSVYWRPSPGSPWTVGHNGTGFFYPTRVWYLPEGATDLGFETYVLVQNPWAEAARVDFTLNTGGGTVMPPPPSRTS